MKIYTKIVMEWDDTGGRYVTIQSEGHEFDGPVSLCCGASQDQTDALNTQKKLTDQIMQQGQQVFGDSSKVFGDLVASLAPTVAAGPSQEGFSAAQLANLKSQAITQTGVAYKNAKAATGNALAGQNGGNTGLPSGTEIGIDGNLASSAAESGAEQLSQINEADYETGRKNYEEAVGSLTQAPGVFNAATAVDNAATSSASGQANTANQIASQNNSWIQGVTGALGGIAGGLATGGMKNLGSGVGFFGGKSSPNSGTS